MTYAIKRSDGLYLTVDETWTELMPGLKADTIRGYTESEEVFKEARQVGGSPVPHPWPTGEQRELFPLWAELGPDGSMKGETK
jgi:hypothetical protein